MRSGQDDYELEAARLTAKGLEGALYPLQRRQLIWVARENGVPPEWLTWLSQLAPVAYDSEDSVKEALLVLKRSGVEEWESLLGP